jgi:transposase
MPEVQVAECSVRRYVRWKKRELGLAGGETFVPQSYWWGSEGQVDWYEAWAELGGEKQKLYVFCMRSMASGGSFHRAYPHASQQAFLEAHELAFRHFGGVFELLRFDNLKSAVKKSCAGTSARKPTGSSRSARIGGSAASAAIRRAGTRRAAWKRKVATSGGTTWFRCRRHKTWST